MPADKRPLQATSSVSSLGLCESSAEKPVAGEEYSLEGLIPSDNEEPVHSSPSLKGRLMQDNEDEAEGEESDSDDILMEDNQVADFASSMLAAISCWHYRARALLSMDFTTVRFSATKGILSYPDLNCNLTCMSARPPYHVACALTEYRNPLTAHISRS